jgi:hypothetical protein
MPPPIIHPCLHLEILPETFYVKQYPPAGEVPPEVLSELNVTKARSGIFSVTRTAEEISVVGEAHGDAGDWRCIKIAGPMEFGFYFHLADLRSILTGPLPPSVELTGVICSFATPLKDAKIPLFAISTWSGLRTGSHVVLAERTSRNTDYVLVPKGKTAEAVSVLGADGWQFT